VATVFDLLDLLFGQTDPDGQHFGVPTGGLAQLLQARAINPIHG
jgi:hypothetical protein